MPHKKRIDRLQLMLDEDELATIDDWRFENKMPTRSAAVRALVHMGLEKSKEHDGPILNRPISSASIGIVDGYADDRRINFPKANRILVVEDEFLIAQGIKNIVHSLGYGVIGPVAEETAAIDLIESEKPAAAIIDIRLRGKNISRLPVALMDFNVPFFYCTAFAPGDLLPKQLCEAPVVNKLAVEELLPATLRNLLH